MERLSYPARRKAFLVLAVLVVIAGIAVASAVLRGKSNAPIHKNIVLIVIDDLNTEVGFMGAQGARTPHLDALADRAVVFEHAYAQAPLCNPSRTSFLTGTYPSTTGIYGLKPDFWDVEKLAQLQTLPGYFRQAGYYTGSVGKVFNHQSHEPSFDFLEKRWFGGFGPVPPEPLQSDFSFDKYFDWGTYLEEHQTSDYQVASVALEFLKSAARRDGPFFLTVGFFRPHTPEYAPREYFERHSLDDVTAPEVATNMRDEVGDYALRLVHYDTRQRFISYLREEGRARSKLRAYRAAVSLVDAQVGRLIEQLKRSGLADDTVLVLASDHGVQNGAKNLWFKRTLWEESAQVPLLMAVPGLESRRIAGPVGLIDIFPTLVDLAGLQRPAQLEGQSLMPQLIGQTATDAMRTRPVLTVHGPGNFALRDNRWRYIAYADGSEELYDHSNDPQERVNLALLSRRNAAVEAQLNLLRQALPAEFAPFAPGTSGFFSRAFPGY